VRELADNARTAALAAEKRTEASASDAAATSASVAPFTRRVPSCRAAWRRTEASSFSLATTAMMESRAAAPPSIASSAQIACQRA